MKQNQRGVSMVSLVITIIVIIILAAVAFSGSRETIGRAEFSGYTTDIDSVRTAFITEGVTSLIGEEETKNNTVTKAQAYNYLAKGATTKRLDKDERKHAWLSKSQASAIPCTRIEKEYAKDAIGIKLPKRKVNTHGATGVEVEYFVTNKGDIFTWPPFFRSDDGLFYVNDVTPVAGSKVTSGDWLISGDDEAKMYEDGFKFMVNGVEIKIQGTGDALTPITVDLEPNTIKGMASIGYKDERNPEQPVGIETEVVYQDDGTSVGGSDGEGENNGEGGDEEEDFSDLTTVEGCPLKFGSAYYSSVTGLSIVLYADGRAEGYVGTERALVYPAGSLSYEGCNIKMQGVVISTCSEDGTSLPYDGATYTLYGEICPHGDAYLKNVTSSYTGDAYCVYCGQLVKQGTTVATKSITEVAKVGDYVRYEANGVTNWRVFDIQNGEVIITPEFGGVGSLTLSGADDYANAVDILDKECQKYTNSALGITANDIRSMTVEDINRVTGYIPETTSTRNAYYLNGDDAYTAGTIANVSNGKTYNKKQHYSGLYNGWTEPRFYTWDANPNTSVSGDENGNQYAYPTEGNPVYVTHDYYWYDPSEYTHKKNSSVNVGSLLGLNWGWLASPCVDAYERYAIFYVRNAYSDGVNASYMVGSDGDSDSGAGGVRPLVFLGSGLQATGAGVSGSPWVLSK